MGSSIIAIVRAYREKGSSGAKIGIGGRAGIGASSNKDVFRPSRVPLLLRGALSIIYSRGVDK